MGAPWKHTPRQRSLYVHLHPQAGRRVVVTGRIVIDLFTTLDGVAQAPGGREEDPEGGFRFGGWQAPLMDAGVGEGVDAGMQTMDALLLGRRTYEIFAPYWPHQGAEDAPEISALFDRIPKYVATRDEDFLIDWAGTSRVGGELPAEIAAIRSRHSEVHVIGSIDFVQTLLAERLYDELKLWVYPIVLGQGKKVFPDGAVPMNMRLIGTSAPTEQGVIELRYAPAAGEPATGEMGGN